MSLLDFWKRIFGIAENKIKRKGKRIGSNKLGKKNKKSGRKNVLSAGKKKNAIKPAGKKTKRQKGGHKKDKPGKKRVKPGKSGPKKINPAKKKRKLKSKSSRIGPKALKKTGRTKPVKKIKKNSGRIAVETREKEIGVITHYFDKISVGIIKLKSSVKTGDKIHIKGAHDDFIQPVESMQINHKDVSYAKKGDEIGVKMSQRAHENDKVYRAG